MRMVFAGFKTVTRRFGDDPWARVQVGDRLWFREAFQAGESGRGPIWYFPADGVSKLAGTSDAELALWRKMNQGNARPGILMPRFVCRKTAIVTSIRKEPIQEITEADAVKEGVEWIQAPELIKFGSMKAIIGAFQEMGIVSACSPSTARLAWYDLTARQRFEVVARILGGGKIWDENGPCWRIEWGNE
jgi:hypothetical protein